MSRNVSSDTMLQTAAVATGNGTAMSLIGYNNVICQVEGITTATVTWEATQDGTNWVGVALANLNSTTRARALTATADGMHMLDDVAGMVSFRARISAWTTGTINVTARASG